MGAAFEGRPKVFEAPYDVGAAELRLFERIDDKENRPLADAFASA